VRLTINRDTSQCKHRADVGRALPQGQNRTFVPEQAVIRAKAAENGLSEDIGSPCGSALKARHITLYEMMFVKRGPFRWKLIARSGFAAIRGVFRWCRGPVSRVNFVLIRTRTNFAVTHRPKMRQRVETV